MDDLVPYLLLVTGAVAVAGLARRRGVSAPLLLVVVGLATSFIPGADEYRLDPDVALIFFLAPLLFSAALSSSYLDLRSNLRPIALLSVGLVLFTATAVALTANLVAPDMGLAVAFALGAIVAPPDAVSALSVGRSVGLPRRMLVVLGGESLFNDATALTAYRVAVTAAVGCGFSLVHGVGYFLYAAAAGLLVGLAVGLVVTWLTDQLDDPVFETVVILLAPLAAYLPVEHLGASGVLSVVVAGLYVGHRSSRSASYSSRLHTETLWRVITFVLESVVFALIGLQLPSVLAEVSDEPAGEVIAVTVSVVAVVFLARAAWIFPVAYLPRLLFTDDTTAVRWQVPAVLSWAGMRGVVSLAAAFALPVTTDDGAPFPQRDLLQFLTFAVVIVTLVLQGVTLPALIRRLGVASPDETQQANLAEAAAQQAAASAALARLDALVAQDELADIPDDVLDRLRQKANARALRAWERLGGAPGPGFTETPTASYRRLRLEMLAAERAVFHRLRESEQIDDEVLRRVVRDLDFEEATLARD